MAPPRPFPPPSLALIACRVVEAELEHVARDATHVVRREFLELQLHDHPAELHRHLAAAVARAEADRAVNAIALAYGLCGRALVGLSPRRCRVVVPRAHDCVTLLLGNKERYAARMQSEPGTYWFSPGWTRGGRVVGPGRDASLRREYAGRFTSEQIEALLELEREGLAQHHHGACVDHGLPGDEACRARAACDARALGWSFDAHPGDPALLRDLILGPWDEERFLVVAPGEQIAQAVDERILQARPVPVAPPAP